MDSAQQHALHWAFFVDIMDMPFDDIFDMFLAWRESLPEDKMAEIMATAEALTEDAEDMSETLHTEAEIWDGLGDAPDGTWVEDVPTSPRPLGPKGPSVN